MLYCGIYGILLFLRDGTFTKVFQLFAFPMKHETRGKKNAFAYFIFYYYYWQKQQQLSVQSENALAVRKTLLSIYVITIESKFLL